VQIYAYNVPEPLGQLTALPRPFSWILGGLLLIEGREGKEKGIGREKEGKVPQPLTPEVPKYVWRPSSAWSRWETKHFPRPLSCNWAPTSRGEGEERGKGKREGKGKKRGGNGGERRQEEGLAMVPPSGA